MRWLVVLLVVACRDPNAPLTSPCDGSDCTAHVHPPGILDPASSDFHGTELGRRDWDFALCQGCHGADYAGGTSGVSCLTCHAQGPTACATCHADGAPYAPAGAHAIHTASFACSECHVVPASYSDPGHFQPTVTFGALARTNSNPTWDGTTCTNVYCHGSTLHGGTTPAPRWDATPTGSCSTCHGAPPPSHQRNDCATCHLAAKHVDGVVQVGSGCSDCHGSPASPAPPRDLAGNTAITAIGVGAHQRHLSPQFSAPVACATCHVVPVSVTDGNHLAPSPAIVDALLGWDRAAQTCSGAACHMQSRPVWTSTGQVTCGSCHGLPPQDPYHFPGMPSCTTCHPDVDDRGAITQPERHADGIVDLR